MEESFDRTVEEGAQRLNRSFRDVLITGLFGGILLVTALRLVSASKLVKERRHPG